MSKCTMKNFCLVHNFTHGKEAEELRVGIQEIVDTCEYYDNILDRLQDLLDSVDARDSLGYLETQNP